MAGELSHILDKLKVHRKAQSPVLLPGGRQELIELIGELGYKVGAEIGVERGWHAQQLLKAVPDLKLYGIDKWQVYEGGEYTEQSYLDRCHREALELLEPLNIEIIEDLSLEAVKKFKPGSLDFVYIDANHDFDFVINDIIEWSKIVRPGGIVSGHDYVNRNMAHTTYYGIIEATNAYTRAHHIRPWFVFNSERGGTWFWVKP